MAQEIFNRIEKKYMLYQDGYQKLMKELGPYITLNSFGHQTICNLYFDNSTYEIARNSISKPVYKEKIRVRSYGIPDKDTKVFLELKKKYKKMVNKRRIGLTLQELERYLYFNRPPEKNKQIFEELDYCIKTKHLVPTMYVAYDRVSYFANSDENLRITFDSNLRYRKEHIDFEYGDVAQKFFDQDVYIMEIKTLNAIPLWLVDILSRLEIYPTSFSKYGEIYKKEILKREWERV